MDEGKCFIVKSIISKRQGVFTDEGAKSDGSFLNKSFREYVSSCEKLIDKLHSILKSLNTLFFHYDSELTKLRDTMFNFRDSLIGVILK